MEKKAIGKSGDGFIDRSKVRILLCDSDAKSSEEAFTLLCKCSYQVSLVRSPRQVIDALNAEGSDIDIILSEVDLPMSKGLKMLKYITRDKELRRIPVIMMSAHDEVSVVVKCLRFGAADYLVKPLRVNELLNMWTHIWRRRRMLGLAEKNILNYDFDTVVSDPSDANTNSTTLFSDDADEKSRKRAEARASTNPEDKTNGTVFAPPIETSMGDYLVGHSGVPQRSDRLTGTISSFPKKGELKIGESSAFFTYVKSSIPKSNNQGASSVRENSPQHLKIVEKLTLNGQVSTNIQGHNNRASPENHSQKLDLPSSNYILDSFSKEGSSTPSKSPEISQPRNSKEFSQVHMLPRNESTDDVTAFHAHTAYPYYISGIMNHLMMSSAWGYEKNLLNLQNHANSAIVPQYNHIPHYSPHATRVASYPYYPVDTSLQPGQMPMSHHWPAYINSSSTEWKSSKVDCREAALMKFKQKRKERCFDKKIRYVNRKRLAERRPRVRGQFVKKVNGVNVDHIGQPASAEDEKEVEEG
ncbi:Two-component response regulator-like APRR1 [Abeliophyllum distichum]|uniref:Two-component response regulator-like APRR1 n=1 Tax=Abeliophyllum distichum TaxID=126358 RepID=A0ABD1RX42_9LAMI